MGRRLTRKTFGLLRLRVLATGEIIATWVLIATAISTGSPLLMAVLKALGVLYLLLSFVLVSRYHTSDFGRKWVPVALKRWFAAPIVVRIRRTLPPFGPAVARVGGIVLALHTPLLMAYSVVGVLVVALREKSL